MTINQSSKSGPIKLQYIPIIYSYVATEKISSD